MNDQEYHANVDHLLEEQFEEHQDFERAISDYIEAGQAFLAEARDGGNIRRLRSLRQAINAPHERGRMAWDAELRTLNEILGLLDDWRLPGPEYLRFKEQANRLLHSYHEDMRELADSGRDIKTAIDAFDQFLRTAR